MTMTRDNQIDNDPASSRDISLRNAIGLLAVLTAGRILIAWLLFDPVRVWLHWDDYCRALFAYDWGQSPFWYPSDVHWLPLPFYLYGLACRVDPSNLQLCCVIVSQVAASLTLFVIYGIGQLLHSRLAGVVGAGLFTFAAWQTVMSYSGLAEPVYYLLSLAAMWCFLAYWRNGRTSPLLGWAVLMAMAALARYEGWIVIALCEMCLLHRWWRRRDARRGTARVIACAALPWLVPLWWMLINFQVHGVPLQFLEANREAFTEALWELSPLERVLRYPVVLITLSPMLSALLILSGLDRTQRAWARCRPLGPIVLIHLGLLVVMYASGSGPSFVHRIVLWHLYAMLPVGAVYLAMVWYRRSRYVRAVIVLGAVGFAASGVYEARAILDEGRQNDYREVGDEYMVLARYLRETWTASDGRAAVQAHDGARFVHVHSGIPGLIVPVTSDDAIEVLDDQRIRLLCIPSGRFDAWIIDPRIESAFRSAHEGRGITERDLDGWRLLRAADIPPGQSD